MTKFEYKVVEIKPKSIWASEITPEIIEQKINEMGSEGWELVNALSKEMTGVISGITFIFKRLAIF